MTTTTCTRHQIVAAARHWLDTPWQHQQRMHGVAVDCAGLVICVARAIGAVAPDFDINGYSRNPDGTLLAVLDEHLLPIPREQLQPGDVVVLSIVGEPQHLGIVGDYRHGGLSIIHASSTAGRVIETRLMFAGNFQFRAAYRFPRVID